MTWKFYYCLFAPENGITISKSPPCSHAHLNTAHRSQEGKQTEPNLKGEGASCDTRLGFDVIMLKDMSQAG